MFVFRILKRLALFLLLVFILPALASIGVWQTKNHAASWNVADWTSAGILPSVVEDQDAVIYLMAARTGRLKGALALHSWIVVKDKQGDQYRRYEVVGWGQPVRFNAYAPDARWYSNEPEIISIIRGEEAEAIIPKIEATVRAYPHSGRGAYTLWPGPNSNSFVAYVLNQVPELGLALPPNAVGRDFIAPGKYVHVDPDWLNVQASLNGYAGFAIGKRHGVELNFLGLVTGIDVVNPAIKLPGFGRIGF